ncbi:hypothetical protein WKH56_05385 [Priestia sp. SB1]
MNIFKNIMSKDNLKGIIIYLILVFVFTLCFSLYFPSVRHYIVNLFNDNYKQSNTGHMVIEDPHEVGFLGGPW